MNESRTVRARAAQWCSMVLNGAQWCSMVLNGAHDRTTTFNSGSAPLDRYLREQVTQDVRRRVAACFVATTDGKNMAGYYTLASASLLLAELSASTWKNRPSSLKCNAKHLPAGVVP